MRTLLIAALAAIIASSASCAAIDKRLGCPTYQNTYCSGRWICDTDKTDGCEICECMPFYGPNGEVPWEAPGY
jgi:hypothetical protein